MSLGASVGIVYGGLSVVTFALYGWDKHQARRTGRRVPELRLHALGLLGGFPGAWLAMRTFRHKTQKPLFGALVLGAALLHALAWGWWLLAA